MKKLFLIFFWAIFCTAATQSYGQHIDSTLSGSNPFKETVKQKSPAKAFLLSMGATMGSFLIGRELIRKDHHATGGVLLATGLFLGPSAGNIYVGNVHGVGKGLGTRFLATASFVGGGFLLLSNTCFSGSQCPKSPLSENIIGSALFYGGIGLFLYSTFYDWINSAEYAKKLNRKNGAFHIKPGLDTRTNRPTLGFNLRF